MSDEFLFVLAVIALVASILAVVAFVEETSSPSQKRYVQKEREFLRWMALRNR